MELYSEESSLVQHWNKLYCVNKLIALSRDIVPTNVLLHLVTWNLKKDIDMNRVISTDIRVPVIGIKEKNRIYILDGEHRIQKLNLRKAGFARVKLITTTILNQCLFEG